MFTIPTSNETAIIPKIVVFKAYIINQWYSFDIVNLKLISKVLKKVTNSEPFFMSFGNHENRIVL